MKRQWLPVCLALVAVLLLSGVMWRIRAGASDASAEEPAAHDHAAHEEGEAEHEGEGGTPQVPGLTTRRITRQQISDWISLPGEIRHNEDSTSRVGSPVSGRVVSLRVRVGDQVRAGQTLAVIASRDVAEVKAALVRAQAEERAAVGRLSTVRRLADAGALTEAPLEEARRDQVGTAAAVKQAQSEVTRAVGARETAVAELERVKKLAAAKAFQARPVEEAQRELAEAQLEVDTAQASVRVRKLALERGRRLFDAGIAARRDVEAAEAEFDEAQAQLAEAESHVSIARRALTREETISNQDLHTSAEVRQAQDNVRQAERDLESARAELERARGHLGVSEAALTRERRIAGGRLNARKELQEAEAQVGVARAEVAAARNSLAAFRAAGGRDAGGAAGIAIVAPVSGTVTERDASLGQAVEASGDLFVIQSINPAWVVARAHEKDLPHIGKGQQVEVRVKGYPQDVFSGTVGLVETALDEKSRTALVRCVVPNDAGVLKPGMFASVDIITEEQRDALLVPAGAVLDEGGEKVVFVACADCPEDRKAGKSVCGSYDKLTIKTGARSGDEIEVVSGLESGADVVVTGQYQLKTALGAGTLQAGCADGH